MVGEGLLVEARAIVENGLEVSNRLQNPPVEWNMRLLNVLIETQSGYIGAARAEEEALGILADARADHHPGQSLQTWIAVRLIGDGRRMGSSGLDATERLIDRAKAEQTP